MEGSAGLRHEELRLARKVRPAADHVHREARDAKLLAAAGIEVAQLGDRRSLALESKVVDATLIHPGGRRAEHGLRGPAHLALDLPDELLDRRGGRQGLLPLDAEERRLVLLVREVDLHHATHEQRPAYEERDQSDILTEEASVADHVALTASLDDAVRA
ncbi:MAG: hypothetical protein DME11_17440, partial [Candidatus Rokuibacteriota bacterium]